MQRQREAEQTARQRPQAESYMPATNGYLTKLQFWIGVFILGASGGVAWGVAITRISHLEQGQEQELTRDIANQKWQLEVVQRMTATETATKSVKESVDSLNKNIWDVRTRDEAARGK